MFELVLELVLELVSESMSELSSELVWASACEWCELEKALQYATRYELVKASAPPAYWPT
ncbi:hypothetical protein ACXJJ3_15640 [Kribbella sp. WER1]